ncbi:flagellar filament capping protein FliD [Nocardioides dongkuii]|uniref:flagellar filament capping protein FliD n=1 Tax=Nocardioides dongkuii TaxID=2760089 RepID=UPI0015FE1076|nr:flagellar filament capping protein FliD [Nocardioides dongkuii]
MATISGLASGLDTSTIINQLMQLEAVPQDRLKTRVSTEKSVLTTLQNLNAKVAALATKAADLAKPAAWSPLTATSSNAAVTITTGPTASPGSLSATVTSVARSHQLGYAEQHALGDQVTGASTDVLLERFDGSPQTLATDGTLTGLVAAINDPANATGLRASAIQVSEGRYQLLVESTATGAAQDFALTAADGSPLLGGATVRPGADATLDLGAGIRVTSGTNTFTDVMPGITLALGAGAKVGDVAALGVTRDTGAVTAKVKDLVDSINAVLADIDVQTSTKGILGKPGALAGDATLRNLRSALVDAVYPADNTSMASLGIQVNRNGRLELDSTKLTQAYAADPVGVAERFSTDGDGFAARMATVTKGASDRATGSLTLVITGRETGVGRLEDSIEDWDNRLALRRSNLERQYTALETALSQMSSQSSWLSSQLSSLSSS